MKKILTISLLLITVILKAQVVPVYTGTVVDTQYVKTLTDQNIYGVKKYGTTTNNVQIDRTNGIVLNGTTTCWDDITVAFASGVSGVSGYPTFNADSLSYNWQVDTTGVSKCIQYYLIEMPHNWKEGTNIHPHVHYKYTTGQGTPTFVVKYKWFNLNTKQSTAWSWIRLSGNAWSPSNYVFNLVEDINDIGISATGKTLSSMLKIQLYLYTTSGVTKTCDAFNFGIHYEIDSFGSKEEIVK